MKKAVILLFVAMFCISAAYAVECGPVPADGCTVTSDTVFSAGTYNLPKGISIKGKNIELDCNGAILKGDGSSYLGGAVKTGITAFSPGFTIRNCHITEYQRGIYSHVADHSNILNNKVYNNPPYGIWLESTAVAEDNLIEGNDIYGHEYGLYLTAADMTISNNNIHDNSHENLFLRMPSTYSAVAESNWWGTATESEIEDSIFDCEKNNQLACVDYDPWLCTPYPSADTTSCRGEPIPEFTTLGSILALLGCAGIVFVMRKR